MAYPASLDNLVDNVDNVLATHINTLQAALGISAWVDWTPTVTQSGSVTVTVTRAKYKLINKVCHLNVLLAITGAGTANNAIVIAGQPAAIQTPINNVIIGTGMIFDNGTAWYQGSLYVNGATDWRITGHLELNVMGVAPNFALANGDIIYLNGAYEVG